MPESTSDPSNVEVGIPRENHVANFFALFGSLGTLVCCALPAAFVALGMGATFASLVNLFPGLVGLSVYKTPLFLGTGAILGLAGAMHYRARNLPCPADPQLARACTRTRRISLGVYWVSVVVYAVGVFFSFVLPYFLL